MLFIDNNSKNIVGNPSEHAISTKLTDVAKIIVPPNINRVFLLFKILLILVIIVFLFSFFTT